MPQSPPSSGICQERYGPGVPEGSRGLFAEVSLPAAVVEAIYIGFNGLFASNAHDFHAQTLGGRMTTLAMGFLILLKLGKNRENLDTFEILWADECVTCLIEIHDPWGQFRSFKKTKMAAPIHPRIGGTFFLKPIHSDKQHLRDVTRMMVSREV